MSHKTSYTELGHKIKSPLLCLLGNLSYISRTQKVFRDSMYLLDEADFEEHLIKHSLNPSSLQSLTISRTATAGWCRVSECERRQGWAMREKTGWRGGMGTEVVEEVEGGRRRRPGWRRSGHLEWWQWQQVGKWREEESCCWESRKMLRSEKTSLEEQRQDGGKTLFVKHFSKHSGWIKATNWRYICSSNKTHN